MSVYVCVCVCVYVCDSCPSGEGNVAIYATPNPFLLNDEENVYMYSMYILK